MLFRRPTPPRGQALAESDGPRGGACSAVKPRVPSESAVKAITGAPPPPTSVEAPRFIANPIVKKPQMPAQGSRAFDAILKPALIAGRPTQIRRS